MNIGNRIKDPEAIVLPSNYVLMEVHKKPTKIINPDPDNPHNIDYISIIRIGAEVKEYEVGDIVLESDNFGQVTWETRGRFFVKMMASNLKLVVKKDNFSPDDGSVKPNLLIN